MKMSELSALSGVSIPTIKYYLREGLLHPGVVHAANQADYGDDHVRRLRLIRVLIEVGHLSIANVVRTLDAVDDATISIHDAFGVAQDALSPAAAQRTDDDERAAARREVERWLRARRWNVRAVAGAKTELVEALVALRRFGWADSANCFDGLADFVVGQAAVELDSLPATGDRSALMEAAIVGTVVFEGAYGALRRLALEHHSHRRYSRRR